MAKKTLTILAVCGSGVVSSSLVAQKIEDVLKPLGAHITIIGLVSTSVKSYVERGNIDFVVSTSPIQGVDSVPIIKGVGLLTGFGEEECLEEILETAKKILASK